jgi:hypothetical protein
VNRSIKPFSRQPFIDVHFPPPYVGCRTISNIKYNIARKIIYKVSDYSVKNSFLQFAGTADNALSLVSQIKKMITVLLCYRRPFFTNDSIVLIYVDVIIITKAILWYLTY